MKLWPFKSKETSAPVSNQLGALLDTYELQTELSSVRKELDQAKMQNLGDSFSMTDSSRWAEMLGGGMHSAGQVVNHITALRSSAVFSCVRLISSAICCAPVKVYQRQGDLRVLNSGHPCAEMLRLTPNRFMSAATFWKMFMHDKLLMGNAYAHIIRNPRTGKPLALMPVKAWMVQVYFAWELGFDRLPGVDKNELFYGCMFDDGNYKIYGQKDMIHVPNLGWNGRGGISTLQAMAQAVGVALGADHSTASFFANGLQTANAISFPQTLDKDALDRLKHHLEEKYTGAKNHHKPLILFGDAKISPMAMTAADAQLLESRKFSVIDICRFFGVHPVMVGENEKTSSFGGGVEQMGRWFNTLTLNEHFTSIEQELELKLFGSDGNFAEFDETAITRGDLQARADYYKAALGSIQQPGWMSPNEVRTEEGQAPKAGAGNDDLFKPVTTAPDAQPAQGGE